MIDSRNFIKEHEGIILEALNDYKKWFNDFPNKSDNKKIDEIDRTIGDLQEALNIEAEFIPVCHISKDDLKQVLRKDKKGFAKIDKLTEDDLVWIADKMNDSLCYSDSYSMALESAFECWNGK
jgi:hypothetical protein